MEKEKVPTPQCSQYLTPEYLKYQEEVVTTLENLTGGKDLASAIIARRNFIHLLHYQDVVGVEEIKLREGYGAKATNDDTLDTCFHNYLARVINPQINSGVISDGSHPGDYDDRKVRWSGAGVTGFWSRTSDILTLEVAPTSYPHCRQDMGRSPLEALKMMALGLEKYQDPYAYFARGMGVAVIPLTVDGKVYLGERSSAVDCSGKLNFVAGWATFASEIEEINFWEDARRELEEEVGITMDLDQSNTKFIGISGNPLTGEVDLVFVVQTTASDRDFQSELWSEHTRLVPISNKREAQTLLDQGWLPGESQPKTLMYSSRLGLEYLVKHHW